MISGSAMRQATHDESTPLTTCASNRSYSDPPTSNRKQKVCPENERKERIRKKRGAFKFLPVFLSNDIVHGSWWFTCGSLLSAIIPIIPLMNENNTILRQSSNLPLMQNSVTFILLIISGIIYTIGSLAFVRASEDPPMKPLFSCYHFHTGTHGRYINSAIIPFSLDK